MMTDEVEQLFSRAAKHRLVEGSGGKTVLDRAGIEALLPHRAPFLLVDRLSYIDLEGNVAVGHYRLEAAASVFAGHFPSRPVYPGVLQIEMVGQVGLLLRLLRDRAAASPSRQMFLTHVLGARFLRPVGNQGELEIAVKGVDDESSLFSTGVGQCIYGGEICSVAGVACVIDD